MSYTGQSYSIPFLQSGLNMNFNMDAIPPTGLVDGTRNVNLNEGGIRKRGGTAKVNGSAVSGTPRIMGIFDFQLSSSSFQVFAGNDGKLYKNSTTTIKTGMSTTNKYSFAVFGNELYVCDGDTTPQTWDGAAAATSNITTPAADWSGGNQPFQVLSHGLGVSRRLWFLYSNAIYYSSLGDGKVVNGGTSGKITIDTGDAYGLVGGIEFGNRLMVFSRNNAYIIDDTDASIANWGYEQVQWRGGLAHWRLLVKTPNDFLAMTEDGEIYSVVAVQQYGDYKIASILRPAFMDRWIRDNVKLSSIDDFHACYDPTLRAVKFFVVRTGQTQADTALVYFIDRPPEYAWTIHDNQSYSSGYKVSASAMVRVSTGSYVMYTGDHAGFIWKLEQANRNDDSNGFYGGLKTSSMIFENSRVTKHYKRTRVITKNQGNFILSVNWWVDGVQQTAQTISLSGAGDVFGTGVFNTSVFAVNENMESGFDMGQAGKRVQIEIYNSSANQDFFVSQLLIDHKLLGVRPA